jgi:MRG-binding protein
MICIHIDMRSHGFASDDAPHTRIPGVWKKLSTEFDLDALDTRENEYAFSEDPDPTNPKEAVKIPDFELPEDEFGELMWNTRFHREASAAASSPPLTPVDEYKDLYAPGIGLLKDLPDGIHSQKAESVAEATPTQKNAKSTRAGRAKSGKGTKAGASAAKNSKPQSTVSESAEEEEEDDDDAQSSVESEEDSAPTTRRTNRAKPKSAPKRTRKR